MAISWNVLVSPPLRPALGLCENYVRARNGPQGLEHELYPANLDYALHSRDWAMRGGGLLGASRGRWQKCASIKRGQPESSPACKRASGGPGEGWAGKAATQACLRRNLPVLRLLPLLSSP